MLLRSVGSQFNQAGCFGRNFGALNTPFSPLSLFANGEQGLYWHLNDFSTMFQDSAGTTPVTAVEQPVGLILDKSKGLALGAELVTNPGNPFVSTAGYSAGGSATISVDTGRLGVSQTTGFTDGVLCALPNNSFSRSAVISFTIDLGSSTLVQVQAGNGNFGNGSVITVNITASGTYNIVTTTFTSGSSGLTFKAGSASNFFLSRVSVREIAGNHASQTTSTSRPVLRQEADGRYYLAFDGTDDFLVTGTINPGSVDKCQVFAGVRKLSDAATGFIAEFSANSSTGNNGSFGVGVASSATTNYFVQLYGSGLGFYVPSPYAAPITNTISAMLDIGGASLATEISPSINGAVSAQGGSGSAGTGNFGSYALYIGRRGGTTLPFNGRLYGLIVRFSAANLSDADIARTETWMNTKTGAY